MPATATSATERTIFEASLGLPKNARPGFIAERCAGDKKLEQRVLRLVAADARAREAGSQVVRRDPNLDIGWGPYRAIEKLGEGGMGVVYLAEQTRPVRRRVALKIIKLGMDSKEVVARFESERQALAMLDHRNIARILEAGTTDNGRPAFAMEYVPGEPIVAYSCRNRLSLVARLQVFVDVCLAMQHAHQKGIIHRDLKPSNVLVMEDNGVPTPKIIDFGIAKATSTRLTDRTLNTAYGSIMGTPQYMSPEQASPGALDVDTRSDVYSLGVILYELVVGALPFSFDDVDDLLEMQRIVRENEIAVPSSRLAGGDRRAVKGELDWILMTALAKDPNGRYQTAQAFAEDVTRYLKHEPVRAGRAGIATRARKFVRRHGTLFAATAIVFTTLVAGLTLASFGLVEARRERDAARAARDQSEAVTEFLQDALSASNSQFGSTDVTVRTLLDEASDQLGERFENRPMLEARLRETIGASYLELALYDEAEANLNASASILARIHPDDHPDRLRVDHLIATIYHSQGRLEEGEALSLSLLERSRRAHGDDHPGTIGAINALALVYTAQGRDEEVMELQELELRTTARVYGDEHVETLRAMHNLALQYARHGRYHEAELNRLRLLEACRRTLGDEHPLTNMALRGLAAIKEHRNQFAEAREYYREALFLSRHALGGEHPRTLGIAMSFGELLEREGKLLAAESILRHTVDGYARVLGSLHRFTLRASNSLGRVLLSKGEIDAAGALLATAVDGGVKALDPESAFLARFRIDHARYLVRVERFTAAKDEIVTARQVLENKKMLDVLSSEALASASTMLVAIEARQRGSSL